MSANDNEAWARLRLVQGESAVSQWEFSQADTSARLTIGSNPSCQWVVADESVEPFHLVVSWSGQTLSIAGSRESVPLSLDGTRIGTSFVSVPARSRIEFGHCAIVVETSSLRKIKPVGEPLAEVSDSSLPPNKRTLLGVAAFSGAPPERASGEPEPAPVASHRPGPSNDPKATAIGMAAVVPGAPRVPAEAKQEGAQRAARPRSDRPTSNTTYGIGEVREFAHTDVVSPSQLRRTSIAPGGSDSDRSPAHAEEQPDLAHHDGDPASSALARRRRDATPTDTQFLDRDDDGSDPEASPDAHSEAAAPPRDAASEEVRNAWRSRSEQMSAEISAVPPAQFRTSGPPRARGPQPMTIVIALVALACLGVWFYALTTL